MKDVEVKFQIDETFFSKTNCFGKIEYGNEIFERLCEYPLVEMIGRPHSIVRHENMPKEIFQIFWDYLLKKEPVVSYIINKTKYGKFYWVLALVIPLSEGYLSIRIKPTSKYFSKVKEIYAEIKHLEVANNNIIQNVFLSKLHLLGFNSYHEFMIEVLNEELSARAGVLCQARHTNEDIYAEFLQISSEICSLRDTTEVMLKFVNDLSIDLSNIILIFDDIIPALRLNAFEETISYESIELFNLWSHEATETLTQFTSFNRYLYSLLDTVRFKLSIHYLEKEMSQVFSGINNEKGEYVDILNKLSRESYLESINYLEDMYHSVGEFKVLFSTLNNSFTSLRSDDLQVCTERIRLQISDTAVKTKIKEAESLIKSVSLKFKKLERLFKVVEHSLSCSRRVGLN